MPIKKIQPPPGLENQVAFAQANASHANLDDVIMQ